jgi:hypothetical protein
LSAAGGQANSKFLSLNRHQSEQEGRGPTHQTRSPRPRADQDEHLVRDFACSSAFALAYKPDTAVAGVRAKAVIEFLLFEILRLFRTDFGRDERGFGARRITGSVSADAPARTATPAMSAMSVMFFIYMVVIFGSYTPTIPD